MSHKFIKVAGVTCLALAQAQVSAASRVVLGAKDISILQQQFAPHSKALAQSQSIDSLKEIGRHQDFNHINHQRLQQMHQGAEVIGGYAIVHSPESRGLQAVKATVNGVIFNKLSNDLDTKPSKESLASAFANFKAQYKDKKLSDENARVVVFIDKANKAHWAYRLSVMTEDGKSIPKKPSAIVDAKTLKPFVSWNDIKQLKHEVLGSGFGGNELTGSYLFGSDYPYLDITRDDTTAKCYLENSRVKVVDMGGDYYSDNSPMTFSCKDAVKNNTYMTGYDSDGYDHANGAYSPTNDAMYDGYVIKHMYQDWYGLEVLTNYDGSPMQLVMRVHYGSNYENAYWDGKQMTFGDGADWFYPLVSLGVGAHEISHGFTQQHSDLEYWAQSGGMNESFSDMAAQAAEYYSTGEASWLIGERIVKPDSGLDALRYMEKPSRDGRSIDSAEDYYSGLNVHYSSGVYNRLFYLMANAPGWNARKAFDVMVKANQDYWTPYATFESGACGVLSATADYNYDKQPVLQAIHTVGIKADDCS